LVVVVVVLVLVVVVVLVDPVLAVIAAEHKFKASPDNRRK
jgi:hypothetical protein